MSSIPFLPQLLFSASLLSHRRNMIEHNRIWRKLRHQNRITLIAWTSWHGDRFCCVVFHIKVHDFWPDQFRKWNWIEACYSLYHIFLCNSKCSYYIKLSVFREITVVFFLGKTLRCGKVFIFRSLKRKQSLPLINLHYYLSSPNIMSSLKTNQNTSDTKLSKTILMQNKSLKNKLERQEIHLHMPTHIKQIKHFFSLWNINTSSGQKLKASTHPLFTNQAYLSLD